MIYHHVLLILGFMVLLTACQYTVKKVKHPTRWPQCGLASKYVCAGNPNTFYIIAKKYCLFHWKKVVVYSKDRWHYLASYEVENFDKNEIDLESICKLFSYVEHEHYMIRFNTDGSAWCDNTVKGDSPIEFKRFDKCEVIEGEKIWLKTYTGVSPLYSTPSARTDCTDRFPHMEPCTKDGFVFMVKIFCYTKENAAQNPVFTVSTIYSDVKIHDFTIELESNPDSCQALSRLFNFEVANNGNKIKIQYLHRRSWMCMSFYKEGKYFKKHVKTGFDIYYDNKNFLIWKMRKFKSDHDECQRFNAHPPQK